MAKFFKILALILVILSLFTLASRDFFLTVVIIVVALLVYHVGELMDRVAYLEDKLNMHLPIDSEDDLPQVKCNNCGKEYDMDYHSCPYCGKKTEFEHN
ncbi:MAG: hypothetical protein IJ360_04390 [Clostridia bacterium]|nr:hypothetical protein [Clostridia bacterium]